MEYKALFSPAELLDPESNIFHPLEEFVPSDVSFKGLNEYRYYTIDNPEESCRPCDPEDPGVEEVDYSSPNTNVKGLNGRFQSLWARKMPGITPLAIMKE